MIEHLRGNALAYLALFVALGGTAWAASKIDSGDIKDNTIKGKDIRTGQVAGSDLRDGSATGDDVADGSLDGADVEDAGLTGADIADKSIGGGKVDPATKVPNADMLDGHGSTRYGVGLQMGVATNLTGGPDDRFPAGATDYDEQAISPEALELRDFTAAGGDAAEPFSGDDSADVSLEVAGSPTPICTVTAGQPCHLSSNVQFAIPGQTKWNLQFDGQNLEGNESVTYSYRAVR